MNKPMVGDDHEAHHPPPASWATARGVDHGWMTMTKSGNNDNEEWGDDHNKERG